jgi:hypothetical protein
MKSLHATVVRQGRVSDGVDSGLFACSRVCQAVRALRFDMYGKGVSP